MADIQVDPELLRARATQLLALADEMAALAVRARGTAAGAESLGVELVNRHAELSSALGRDVEELTRLAESLRWNADALTECDRSQLRILSKIAAGLAGADAVGRPG